MVLSLSLHYSISKGALWDCAASTSICRHLLVNPFSRYTMCAYGRKLGSDGSHSPQHVHTDLPKNWGLIFFGSILTCTFSFFFSSCNGNVIVFVSKMLCRQHPILLFWCSNTDYFGGPLKRMIHLPVGNIKTPSKLVPANMIHLSL